MKHLLAVLFAAGVTSLFAKTLAWYHFDEVAPGEKPTPETRFLNAVDPAVAPGRPISQIDWWEDKTGTHFPQGVAAFPDGFSALDPVSGLASENARALVFTTGKREDGYYGASGVEIANEPASTTGKITYECFVRFDPSRTPDGMGNNCKRVILAKNKNKDDDRTGFKLVYDYWGDWGRNLMVYVDSDKVVDASEIHLEDCKWHHIALTFDAADSSVRVYADYALVGEKTGLSADLSKMSNEALAVGFAPYDSSCPRWGGVVDELKISDAALTPQQMLKVQSSSTARPVDEDTAAYQSFSLGDEFALNMQMRNEANGEGSLGEPSFCSKGNAPTQIPDVPIRQIGTSEGLVENTKAISFSGYAKGWAFADPSATLIQGDYTAEMFFRISDAYSKNCNLMAQSGAVSLQLQYDGFRINWEGPKARGNFCDGKWHHVALVYVKDGGKYDLYVDYTYRGSKSVDIDPETVEKAFRFGGETAEYWELFHDIDIDEVRITRRALDPNEFIHPYDSTVAWEISCDASDSFFASRLWNSVPDFSSKELKYWYFDSSDKAGAQVADGLLSEPRVNESSIATTGGVSRCGGIILNDPEKSVVTGPFTVEFCYQLADGYVSSDSEFMFYIEGACHIKIYKGELYIQSSIDDWTDIAKHYAPADGKWHHVAVIYDPDKGEFRAYFDYGYLGRREGSVDPEKVGDKIYIGTEYWDQSLRTWKFDNVRVTRKALKPCEFLTSKHVDGPTLAWAYFDNGDGSFAQKYDEAATYSGEATFASRGAGAEVLDAEGNVLRENKGSLRMLSGVASYSRLSLLERTDLTAELFLRAKAIADGTDVLALTVKDATPVWSLRAVNGALKVFAGGTEVADAGTVPASWAHFAVAFDPAADGSSTAVKVYRNHELVDEQSFAGTLAVDGLKDSSLKIGSFDGAVDELRFSKGALGVADMLYRPKASGFILLFR